MIFIFAERFLITYMSFQGSICLPIHSVTPDLSELCSNLTLFY